MARILTKKTPCFKSEEASRPDPNGCSRLAMPRRSAVASAVSAEILGSRWEIRPQTSNIRHETSVWIAHHVQHPVQKQGRPVPHRRLGQRSAIVYARV